MPPILDICADLEEARFAPGESLIAEGAVKPPLFVLLEGRVSVRKGETEIVRVAEPGALFGEISALLGSPATASVVARTAVRARMAPDGAACLAARPELALHAARILAGRLTRATAYISDLKAQFADRSDHFGLVDRVLDTLLQQQQVQGVRPPGRKDEDPRL